jgi:hypothetical protein
LETKVAQENKKRAAEKAAELGTEVKKTGPKQVGAKKDGKDAKAKDAKVKDAKVKDTAGKAKDEAADAAAAAQKAALAALEQKLDDDDKKRNTRLYLPKIFQEYQAGVTTIDLVGRILWHFSDDKTSIEAANNLLESAEKAYPEVPYVKVLRVSYCTFLSTDPSVHLPKLDVIKKMEPGFLSRYYVYKRSVDIRDRAKVSSVTEGENTLDLVAYIEFQNLFRYYSFLLMKAKQKNIIIVLLKLFESFGCYFYRNQLPRLLFIEQLRSWMFKRHVLWLYIRYLHKFLSC